MAKPSTALDEMAGGILAITTQDVVLYSQHSTNHQKFLHQFLLETGIRPSDIFLISGKRTMYLNGIVSYRQKKTGIPRKIKISDDLLLKVRYWRMLKGNFPNQFRNYQQMKNDLMRYCIFRYAYLCPNQKLYYFRYLYVANLLLKKMSLEEISQELGHEEVASTLTYINTAEKLISKIKP